MAKQSTMKADKQDPAIVRGPETAVELSLPLGEVTQSEYVQTHFEISHLNRTQARLLKRLYHALHNGAYKIESTGRYVQNPTDALRWLIEQVASKVENKHSPTTS